MFSNFSCLISFGRFLQWQDLPTTSRIYVNILDYFLLGLTTSFLKVEGSSSCYANMKHSENLKILFTPGAFLSLHLADATTFGVFIKNRLDARHIPFFPLNVVAFAGRNLQDFGNLLVICKRQSLLQSPSTITLWPKLQKAWNNQLKYV